MTGQSKEALTKQILEHQAYKCKLNWLSRLIVFKGVARNENKNPNKTMVEYHKHVMNDSLSDEMDCARALELLDKKRTTVGEKNENMSRILSYLYVQALSDDNTQVDNDQRDNLFKAAREHLKNKSDYRYESIREKSKLIAWINASILFTCSPVSAPQLTEALKFLPIIGPGVVCLVCTTGLIQNQRMTYTKEKKVETLLLTLGFIYSSMIFLRDLLPFIPGVGLAYSSIICPVILLSAFVCRGGLRSGPSKIENDPTIECLIEKIQGTNDPNKQQQVLSALTLALEDETNLMNGVKNPWEIAYFVNKLDGYVNTLETIIKNSDGPITKDSNIFKALHLLKTHQRKQKNHQNQNRLFLLCNISIVILAIASVALPPLGISVALATILVIAQMSGAALYISTHATQWCLGDHGSFYKKPITEDELLKNLKNTTNLCEIGLTSTQPVQSNQLKQTSALDPVHTHRPGQQKKEEKRELSGPRRSI